MKQQSSISIYDNTKHAWDAMFLAISQAKKSIYWEVYMFVDDVVGTRFFDVLKQKVKEGVDVKLIVDFWGSFSLSQKSIENLRNAGIDILLFRQKKFSLSHFRAWWMDRTHRKVLIIDEHIGFIGGVNIQKDMGHWQDIHIRLRGKVVRSLLRSFARTYMMCGGDKKQVKHLLKYKYRVEHSGIDFVYDHYGRKKFGARDWYIQAFKKARERVVLFSPYYFPDKQLLRAMWDARKRGVRIDLVIPFRSDLRLVTYAAYAWFSLLHTKGVQIHLMKKNMMHGKGVIVDDEWAMVGSSNVEHGSLYHNQEANIRFRDKRMVKKLKRILDRWILDADLFDAPRWGRRGRWQRIKEFFSHAMYKFWFKVK